MGAVSPTPRIVCWSARRIRVRAAALLGQVATSSGEETVGVGVVVRCNGNRFADMPYSALFSEAVGVVMWTVVLFVMCLTFFSSSAISSRKLVCCAVI